MRTYKIHLIRHGATDANYLGQYIGSKTDLPLSPEGFSELRLIKDDIEYPDIDVLYSSPLLRCRQTASLLYPEKDIIPVPNFTEYDFGEFEGKTAPNDGRGAAAPACRSPTGHRWHRGKR